MSKSHQRTKWTNLHFDYTAFATLSCSPQVPRREWADAVRVKCFETKFFASYKKGKIIIVCVHKHLIFCVITRLQGDGEDHRGIKCAVGVYIGYLQLGLLLAIQE